MPKKERTTRISLTVPESLKEKLEALGEFPYKSASNAAVVLMVEALGWREGREPLLLPQILESLDLLDASELAEVAIKSAEKFQKEAAKSKLFNQWALSQLSQQTGIPVERLEKLRDGEPFSATEMEQLAQVLKTTPVELKKILG